MKYKDRNLYFHWWLTCMGLVETEWIINTDHYLCYRKNNGHPWSYKEIVLERKR